MQQFKLLNEKEQNAVLNLHGEKSSTISLDEKLQDIFECNGIEVIPVNCVALYKTIPRYVQYCTVSAKKATIQGDVDEG